MAYVLGFFTADGTMIKNKRGSFFIELEITDKNLLEKIRKILGSNHKITERKSTNKNCKPRYRLQIGSKAMFNDLLKLGITPRKSKTIIFPITPTKYFSHFVRGYFDGDGSVTIGKYRRKETQKQKFYILSGFTSGSENFLKQLHMQLKKFSSITGGSLYFHSNSFRLYFSTKDSLSLYNLMYVKYKINNSLLLHRKKKIFEKYFKIV